MAQALRQTSGAPTAHGGAAADKMEGRAAAAPVGLVDSGSGNAQQRLLKRENARLQALVSELRAASPSVARLTDLAVWREREAFEEKKNRALVLLRKKDAKIRELGEVVARRNNSARQRAALGKSAAAAAAAAVREGDGGCDAGGVGANSKMANNTSATAGVVEMLEERVEEQADQIEALLQEVIRLRSATATDNASRTTFTEGAEGRRDAVHPGSHGGRGSVSTQPPPLHSEYDACANDEERRRVRGAPRERPAPGGVATGNLRSEVARLESALSTQTVALTQKDAALEHATAEHREREARLGDRVRALERLQETARRTVLDREERLKKAEAAVAEASVTAAAAGTSPFPPPANPEQGVTGCEEAPAEGPPPPPPSPPPPPAGADGVALRVGAEPATSGGRGPAAEEREASDFAANEWWLHLAEAEKRREEREAADRASAAGRGGRGVAEGGDERGGKEARRLHRLLEEQGLEVVALRQRVLKAEIVARTRGSGRRDDEERWAKEEAKERGGLRGAGVEGGSTKTQKLAQSADLAEMEGRVAALHAQGDTREALMVARETVSALKLALIRTEGEVELHAQLLRDEKLRSVASLSRAEDLQGKVDRMAVEKTLDGVAGGTVSALALIDRFAGTLYRQSRRVKDMEEQVGTMRIRCARLARLARGDTADGGSPSGAAAAPTVASGAGRSDAPGRLRSEERRAEDECWVAAGVQEAAAAMEAGRRRSLEQEVESLRNEVLAERRRADAAQLEARDERRLRSLAAPAGGGVGSSSSQDYTINCTNKGEEAALRRKLELAAGEIEALRTHTRDLRSQVQSGWWSWRPSSSEAGGGGEPLSGGGGGVEEEQEFGFLEGLVSSGAACAAAEAALREVRTTGGGGGGGDDSNVSIEVDRLTSLLSEKDAQIGVLTSTVEALQTSPAFAPPSPRKGGVAAAPGANVDGAAVASSPRLRTDRETARTPTSRGSSRVSSFWAADVSGNGVDDGGGGGVGVLNHVGAQGLARRCVALTVRLTSALAREGRAERRAERLTAEAGRRDRKIRAAARAEEDLARRNRALENAARKTAAALSSLRAESAARLRGAGEEASQLRRALRDAELGADDACQRLASSRGECHALAVELRENRQQHREEVLRLSEAHDARIKECADRLSLDGASPLPQPPLGGHGTRGRRRGATATVAASVASSPVAAAIAELAAQWRAFVSNGMGDDYENDGNNKNRRRRRQRTSASADVPGPSGGGYRPGNKTAVPSGGGGGSKGTVISERQFTATATFLQETAVRLDTECSRAVRRARALEWELAGARRGQLDAATALEEAREEVCRLSARAAVAEASVTAAVLPASKLSYAGHLTESSSSSAMPRSGGSGGVRFGGDGAGEGTSAGTGRWSYYTVAAVSLLEKRFAAAVEDLVAAEAAGAAAVAGEAAANARADAAEAAARESLTRADLLASDLERHKVSATDGAAAEGAAAEWRREIRAELGRWWKDDLLALHSGVVLDWGSAGAADAAAAALTRKNKKMPADGIGGGGGGGFPSGSRYSANPGGESGHTTASAESIEHGVSGEEAMAQALIAGREEQAHLEDRLQLSERRVGKLRGETLRLRATLERWHTEFVAPTLQEAQKCRRRFPPPGDAGGAALEAPQRRPTAAATVAVVDGKGVLERKLLEATAGLLGVREEATGLRREVASLRVLVARLREDENDARETAGRRVESARDASRRRADGDLKDAAERLEEERERFKAQLGAAHAEILRLGAEAAESERRRSFDKERRNREANAARLGSTGEHGGVGDNGPSGEGSIIVDDGGVGSRTGGGGGGGGVSLEEVTGVPTGGRKRPAEGSGREGGGAREEASERERALRREVEGEREALRRMCNGLAVDLKEAVEARSEAKDEREALVQEAARAKAEAKLAGLARENLEAALKELGRLLEFARETAGATRDAPVGLGDDEDRPLHAASLSGWDRPKVEAQRFARVMVAAKVAEADLLRRLRGAASAEAELRHLIRRRDIRIEELKRDLATSDRLGRSMSGGSGSGSNRHHHQRLSLRESGSTSSPGNVSGAAAAAATDTAARGSQAKAMASERAAKEVALNAALKHLELELAEASARGEVGDAVTRAAERFVLRLFPEAENSGGGVGGAWGGKGHCRACGLIPERARRPAVNLADSGRGALFLVPSADVERKAALAASSAALDAAAEAQPETPAAAAGSSSVSANNDAGAVETFPARSPARTTSADTPTRTAGEGGRRNRVSPPSAIDTLGFSSGVQSLEANLARLEAVVAGHGPAGVAKSTDVGPEGLGWIRSSSAPGGTVVEVAWAEAVRGLREQVLDLGHRAEVTEELLEEERAAKGNLDEEVLRLRTELLRQQRSYWQATAKLKQRYEHTLHADNEQESNEEGGPVPLGVAAAADIHETAVSSGARETPPDEDEEGTAATRARAQQQKEEQQQRQQHRSPRADIEERLRDRERELREVRGLHAREAKDVAAELARVVEAHRARVAILEEKLRRTTRKIKAMARPKPKTAAKRGRESVRGGGGDAGGYHCAFSSSTPLSTDELLNLLAAADEEVFEARSRTQRLEFELRAKTAEADAVSLLRDEGGGVAAANPVSTERVVIEGEGNGQVSALAISPSCVTAAAETAAEGTGKVTGLANVAFAARLAAAEAEVATLRQEGLAARELALGAQRESAALKLAAHRRTADRADESRCREKELRRQVSAYKREAERLRSTATAAAALAPTAGKNGGPRKAGGGGASAAAAAAAAGGDAETATLKLRAQQLGAIREESERRGRTIVALRAAKAALGEDVQRLRQEAAGQEEKLARALKDAGVKSNTAKALREKVAALEAEIAALKSTRTKANVTTVAGRVVSAEARGGSLPATDAVTAGSPGDAVGAALEPSAPICDVQTATVRDLRAERDRLRASMRGWHGSLSKKTAEIDAQVAELQRLEAEAGTLRATVARKDDAYRATKKQLLSVREEYEQFKDSSHRWRADAEAKWRGLRRASEAAVRRAKDSEKSGDAAELELAALKSAFRSFLKTLWDDLRSRPPVAPPTTSVAADACPAVPEVVTGHAGRTGNDSSVGQHVSGAGSTSGDGRSGKGAKSWTRKEGDASAAPTSTGLFPVDAAERHEQGESGQEMFAGLAKATVAIAAAREGGGVEVSPIERGGGGGGPFGELTEAEVSDIMQALSLSDDQGGSRLLLSSSSSPSSSSSSSSSLYRNLPVAAAEPTRAGTASLTSHQQQQQQQQEAITDGRVERPTKTAPPRAQRDGDLEKRGFPDGSGELGKEKEPNAEYKSTVFEGTTAFAERVESALGGSNTSAALAEVLRSLRASGLSKTMADVAVDDDAIFRSTPPVARQESTALSRSWSQPTSHPATAAGHPLAPGSRGPGDTVEQLSSSRDRISRDLGGPVLLGGRWGGTGRTLSPLDEVSSAGSPSETAGFGGLVGDNSEPLLVGDLASPS